MGRFREIPRENLDIAKAIVAKHYPQIANRPGDLVADIYFALSEAKRRGFQDCLDILCPMQAANDDINKEWAP